jgi:hypothetical protein
VTTALVIYYLFEVEVEFHGCVYLVSEDIGVGWMHDSSRSLFELLIFKMMKTWISSYSCDSFFQLPQNNYHFKELRCSAQCHMKLWIVRR